MNTVQIPLSGIKFISRKLRAKKMICEIDFAKFKKINEPENLSELIGEARLEHALGGTKKFTNPKKIVEFLEK